MLSIISTMLMLKTQVYFLPILIITWIADTVLIAYGVIVAKRMLMRIITIKNRFANNIKTVKAKACTVPEKYKNCNVSVAV